MYSEERVKEKAVNESGIDTDWYFLDNKGQIAVVASGGGLLPESVSSDMDKLRRRLIDNYNEKQKAACLRDLYFMASRGFYYFDKMVLGDYFYFGYYLKAKPISPLITDKSANNIQDIRPLTFIDGDLESVKHFMVNEIS
ncbi:hypothetical protein AB6805_01045 [Chitinophaga sp. RCC_12]|uniref:hypothetical protein n=1 Tax=Chitinophaga sp. RCC_12 TaxID=3239226 RepID=UPI003525A76B